MGLDAGLAATGEWECMECGYIEAGVKTKRLKVCPDCGAPSQALEFFPYGDDDEDDWDEASDNLEDALLEEDVDIDDDDVR
jgi:predicted  nucleic acid-binding Zn-ribbon protein